MFFCFFKNRCSADGSVLGSGPRGRGFKSRHSDHLKPLIHKALSCVYQRFSFCLEKSFRMAKTTLSELKVVN